VLTVVAAAVVPSLLGIGTAGAVPPADSRFSGPPGTTSELRARASTPPRHATVITTADGAGALVSHAPPGTSFVISSGIHPKFSVVPRPGDRFFAQPGAILDGQHAVPSAFKPPRAQAVNGVMVIGASASRPLVVENYGTSPRSQVAAIQSNSEATTPPTYSSGWWVQWVEVTGDSSRGVSLSDHMSVLDCRVVDNARLGIGGGGQGITIEHDVVSNNGLTVARRGWEAGGIKTVGHDVLIADNEISGNGAPGVWTDGGASHVTIAANTLATNRFGVRVEISSHVDVVGNSITQSEQQAVLVVSSQAVNVRGNDIGSNFGGIIVGGVGREGPGGIHLNDVNVSDNSIVDSGTTGLHQPVPPGTVIEFDNDHYLGEHFQWGGHGIKFPDLQALGQETHGSSVK